MHILQIDKARPANQAQPQPPTAAEITNERVRRALLLMEQHLGDPLPVEEIGRRLNISTRQFERLFRQAVGTSPAVHYRRLRLRYGHWLLRNTSRSVTAIALEAGFADCAHFSRQFRELFGLPPSEVRRLTGPATMQTTIGFTTTIDGNHVADAAELPDRRLFDDGAVSSALPRSAYRSPPHQ